MTGPVILMSGSRPRLFLNLPGDDLMEVRENRNHQLYFATQEYDLDVDEIGFLVFYGIIYDVNTWTPNDDLEFWPSGCDEWWSGRFLPATAHDLRAWGLIAESDERRCSDAQ